jgi:hypothetical protein
MPPYDVTLSWRLNVNRPERGEKTVRVDAANRECALVLAGIRLTQDGVSVYKPSLTVTSVLRRRAW